MVAACQTHSAPVQKITIVPRTSGALGYTMQVDEGEKHLMSKQEMLNRIATLTGGRAAEEVMCHTCTTGASNDIEKGYATGTCHDHHLWHERQLWHDAAGTAVQPILGWSVFPCLQ